MADSTLTPSTSNNGSTVADSSSFGSMVCLYDWWLIKTESDFKGKWLAVSGITSRKEKAVRVFVSAPIVKIYDMFSMETADGIHIVIKGCINEQRTLENGFPPEVFNNFVFGFPPNWESFSVDWFRHESTAGIDLGSDIPENVSPSDLEELSDGVEKPVSTLSKSPEEALIMGEVNVSHGSDSNRHAKRSHKVKVFQQKPASGVAQKHPNKEQNSALGALENPGEGGQESPMVASAQLQSPGGQVYTQPKQLVKNSSLAIGPEVLFDVVEKTPPTLSKSSEEALIMDEVNVSHGSDSNRRAKRSHKVKVFQQNNRRAKRSHKVKVFQQKKPASGVAQKHPNKEQNSALGALENPGEGGLESPMVASAQLQSPGGQVYTQPKQLVKNSSLAIGPEVLFDVVEKPAPTLSKSSEEALIMDEVKASHGSDSNRRAKRSHKVKVFQQKKPASGVAQKHPNKEQNSALGALENPGEGGLESPMAPVQLQSPIRQVYAPPKHLVKNFSSAVGLEVLSDAVVKSIPTSKSPEETLGTPEKSFPTEEFHASKETTGKVGVAHGRGSNRNSTRLHNIKVCKQKKLASERSQKHLDKEQHSSSGALENPDGEGLEILMTPVQSHPPSQVNTMSKKLIENSGSRVSRPFSANEPCLKKQKVTVETTQITSKRKKARSALTFKYPQERDADPLIKEGKEKISSVYSLSSSIKKSRSGRLLLPPLEFWRNQIPIYDAEHEITEIREGASLVSPFKGSLPSLSGSNMKKRAA